MIRLTLIICCVFWPIWAVAQSEDEDKGYLTELLESNLSADNQIVTIDGFEGALSSEARIAQLTIADDDGVWLTLENATLIWTRSALLRGAVDIDELSAARLTVLRGPQSSETINVPNAEATPFKLPELPVSISIGTMAIDEIALGEVFLGEPVTLSINGAAQLAGGEGSVNVVAERLDAREGRFEIDGNYSNASNILALTADLAESDDGIVARLLGLPGRPSVSLNLTGDGPLSDFAADLSIGTDGEDRIRGQFSLQQVGDDQRIESDVQGDVTPLFIPEYRDFFGPDLRLITTAEIKGTGETLLKKLDLSAQHLSLAADAVISPEGWPVSISLAGTIKDPNGAPVLLPIAGTPTRIDELDLALDYDATLADDWTLTAELNQLAQADISIASVSLSGGGIIDQTTGAFTADIRYGANGVSLDDAGLSDALGDEIAGDIALKRIDDNRIELSELVLRGPGIQADISGEIDQSDGLALDLDVDLVAQQINRFSGLAGRDLGGSADLEIRGLLRPLDGIFDVELSGSTSDLAIGEPRLDPVLRGNGKLNGQIARTTDGSFARDFRVLTDAAEIRAEAGFDSSGGTADVIGSLTDVGLIEPKLAGPAEIALTAEQGESGIAIVSVDANFPSANATVDATLNPDPDGYLANVTASLNSTDISAFAELLDRDLSGAAVLNGVAIVSGSGQSIEAKIAGTTNDLKIGQPNVDALLAGRGQIAANFSRFGEGLMTLKSLSVSTDTARVNARGGIGAEQVVNGEVSANLADASRVFPGLNGPISLQAEVKQQNPDNAGLSVRLTGDDLSVASDLEFDDLRGNPIAGGTVTAEVVTLAPFSDLLGRPLGGALNIDVVGLVSADLDKINGTLSMETTDLSTGIEPLDQILVGSGRLNANVEKEGVDITVRQLSIDTSQLKAEANVSATGETGTANFNARLNDIGLFTNSLSGAVTAVGTGERRSQSWGIDVDLEGPGGIAANANGSVADSGDLDLDLSGRAPMGLANDLIAPRRLDGDVDFNLAIDGPANVNSVSGRISVADARMALPTFGQALERLTGNIALSGGSASVDLSANLPDGGDLTATGPISLSAPFDADIRLALSDIVLRDPTLYESSVNGSISALGPLSGGARISGDLLIGETEIQVPSSAVGVLGELPNVTHVSPSSVTRQTINRAGVGTGGTATGGSSAKGPVYPLDLTIRAPSRIFVRGRGLDAELGGALTIGGTSRDVIPVGQFDLVRGRLNILQQRFDLTEGSASLQGDFEPFLRLVARTEADTGTVIDIIVEGPASEPEVTFQSSPELPQDEVLAQLIFGRNLSDISPLQAVQLASAVSTLAGRGGGALDSFRQGLGLDDLDVTTDDQGNAAVRAGAYLSENVYTDVVVGSDGSTEININLDVTNNVTAKGTVDDEGETSLGIFFEKDY